VRVDRSLAEHYIAQGVATLAQTSVGTGADLPTGDGPFLVVQGTGGERPELVHNASANRLPHFQVMVVARSFAIAAAMAESAYQQSTRSHYTFNGVRFIHLRPINEPFGLPKDPNGRNRVAFNVEARATEA
jgi:hypothetical protein